MVRARKTIRTRARPIRANLREQAGRATDSAAIMLRPLRRTENAASSGSSFSTSSKASCRCFSLGRCQRTYFCRCCRCSSYLLLVLHLLRPILLLPLVLLLLLLLLLRLFLLLRLHLRLHLLLLLLRRSLTTTTTTKPTTTLLSLLLPP